MDAVGDEFQQQTKYHPDRMPGGGFAWRTRPSLYKQYPQAPRINLPPAELKQPTTLDQALKARQSIRDFRPEPVAAEQLSYLLWASTGIQRTEGGYAFRTAPSAGALYPIETYLVVHDVESIEPGLYHYAVKDHQLEQLRRGDFGRQIAMAALGQAMCAEAAVVFVWSAVFDRSKFKYAQRAYRYIYLDAGHIAENLALAAVSLNLGSCQIGAFYDDPVNEIFELDGSSESAIYLSAVGRPA
jgi:SagB-type dehydrogenase family enzyme